MAVSTYVCTSLRSSCALQRAALTPAACAAVVQFDIPAGFVLRLALSPHDFPLAWPSPCEEPPRISVRAFPDVQGVYGLKVPTVTACAAADAFPVGTCDCTYLFVCRG